METKKTDVEIFVFIVRKAIVIKYRSNNNGKLTWRKRKNVSLFVTLPHH